MPELLTSQEKEEQEATFNSSSLVQLFRSELQATLGEDEEEEEKEIEKEGKDEEEDEDEEEVAQGGKLVTVDPILISSSDDDNLEVVLLHPIPESRAIKEELLVGELGRQLTYNNTSRNFEIYLAIVQAIILSCDIIELQKEDEVMTCILLIMQNFQRSMVNYQHEKKHSNDLKKVQKKVTVLEDKAEAFNQGWLACLKELNIDSDHSAWFATRPPMAYPEPCLEPYFAILLPGFDAEEYITQPVEGDDNTQVGAAEVEATKEAKKKVDRATSGSLGNPPEVKMI
ncbi:hypothetical protein Acr_21g0004700 [Actinidia rufa]|uniref:Uncharacterized protein n=1 Tax=Actinidia rufa TaxID=165716 RepID=A0A7J0GGM1_9ERIC|nr:hypothetical protein Acr_21g0004700 [Actinidia rufa]